MLAKRRDEAYHPKGFDLRMEKLGYTVRQSKDGTIEPLLQGKYSFANKYIPKTVTQPMMRTNTHKPHNGVSESMKPTSDNTLLRNLPKVMADHLKEVDEKTKHAFHHQHADQTDDNNTTPSNDHQVRNEFTIPSSDTTNTITANRRAVTERISQLADSRRKKDKHKQWHKRGKSPQSPTNTPSSTRSGRAINTPQRYKAFCISVKQALNSNRHQESKEAIRDEILNMINYNVGHFSRRDEILPSSRKNILK
jgi:hypothetical protein